MRGTPKYKDQFTPFLPFVFFLDPIQDLKDGYPNNTKELAPSRLGQLVSDTVVEADTIIFKLISIGRKGNE